MKFRIVIFLALSSCRTSDPDTSVSMDSALERQQPVTSNWEKVLACRERVWPGVSFGESATAFVYTSDKAVRLWKKGWKDATSDQLRHIEEYHEGSYSAVRTELTDGEPLLTIEASPARFEEILNARKTQVMGRIKTCLGADNADEAWWADFVSNQASAPAIVGLAFHEYMHVFPQRLWKINRWNLAGEVKVSDKIDRSELRKYTLAIEARLYAAVTDDDLETSRKKVAQAKFISDQLEAIAPKFFSDYGLFTVQEGSATYVGLVADQLATDGCSTSNDSLSQSLTKKFLDTRTYILADGFEVYLIGTYIAILLDRFGVADWQKLVEESSSMLTLLGTLTGPSDGSAGNAEDVGAYSDLATCLAKTEE